MPYYDFLWTEEIIEHLLEHDVSQSEFEELTDMTKKKISEEMLSQMKIDRELIQKELPDLEQRHAHMREAALEGTLCGRLRQAIHKSRRPLRDIAQAAGLSSTVLCDFLEGKRTLRSDVLDRLALAVEVSISLTSQTE